MTIFISYSKDSERVRLLVQALRRHGLRTCRLGATHEDCLNPLVANYGVGLGILAVLLRVGATPAEASEAIAAQPNVRLHEYAQARWEDKLDHTEAMTRCKRPVSSIYGLG